jgi:hypothetical protein
MGTVYGIYPCGSALVTGRIDGETFLGRLLIFFFGGAGEGNSRARNTETMRRCFAGRCEFQTAPVCMLYIICWAVEVSLQHVFRTSRRGSSILDCPGQTRLLFDFDSPST